MTQVPGFLTCEQQVNNTETNTDREKKEREREREREGGGGEGGGGVSWCVSIRPFMRLDDISISRFQSSNASYLSERGNTITLLESGLGTVS